MSDFNSPPAAEALDQGYADAQAEITSNVGTEQSAMAPTTASPAAVTVAPTTNPYNVGSSSNMGTDQSAGSAMPPKAVSAAAVTITVAPTIANSYDANPVPVAVPYSYPTKAVTEASATPYTNMEFVPAPYSNNYYPASSGPPTTYRTTSVVQRTIAARDTQVCSSLIFVDRVRRKYKTI